MEDMIEREEKATSSTRISPAMAAELEQQRLRLSVLARRELSNNDVIRIMHRVFVAQPEPVVRQAVGQ